MKSCRALAVLVGVAIAVPAHAEDPPLASVGVRARVGGQRVLGAEQPQAFHEIDVFGSWRLPWQRYSVTGWGFGTRLMASAGIMEGADEYALVLSVLPLATYGSRDGRFVFDVGAGVAILSKHQFKNQDYGGSLQGALTAGVTVPLYKRVGLAYRFMHYSDAGAYGDYTIGADFHMIEVIYRF